MMEKYPILSFPQEEPGPILQASIYTDLNKIKRSEPKNKKNGNTWYDSGPTGATGTRGVIKPFKWNVSFSTTMNSYPNLIISKPGPKSLAASYELVRIASMLLEENLEIREYTEEESDLAKIRYKITQDEMDYERSLMIDALYQATPRNSL